MVVNNPPPSDLSDIRLIHAWRSAGSRMTLWMQDMTDPLRPRLLHLVQWGGKLYLPVTEGLKLGIGVYNDSDNWKGVPTYIEAKNLYDDGASQPDDCTTGEPKDDMWEVRPHSPLVMDALMGRDRKTGRPLIIVPSGLGMGVGEATYGTDEYRGQIRVYVRSSYAHTEPHAQPAYPYPGFGGGYSGGPATRSSGPATMGFDEVTRGGPATRSAGPAQYGGGTKGGGFVTRSAPEVGTDHQVGIGAGAEERRQSHLTGVQYQRDSHLVAALCVESRADLAEVLAEARHANTQWYWTPDGPKWFATWTPPAMPVSSHIPVAQPAPHRPHGSNWGGSAY